MGRIMAIDYGQVRTGLAVTDPERIIASALDTVASPMVINYIADYCKREEVDIFVVGEARQRDGSESPSMQYIRPFVEALRATFPTKLVEMMDERYTSKIALQSIIDSGTKKKDRRDKGRIDRVAATLILQDYMELSKHRQQ